MKNHIVLQPNGRFAIWDSDSCDFRVYDADRECLILQLVLNKYPGIHVEVDEAIDSCNGVPASDAAAWPQISWDDCMSATRECHQDSPMADIFEKLCSEKTV